MPKTSSKKLINQDPLAWMNESDGELENEVPNDLPEPKKSDGVFKADVVTDHNSEKIVLDEILNMNKVSALYERIKELLDQGTDIVIDASQVNVIDTSTLQLLVCVSREADCRQHPVQIQEISDSFASVAKVLGIEAMLGIL